MEIKLHSGSLAVELSVADAIVVYGCDSTERCRDSLSRALQHPLELPVLQECVVPGDRVVLVLDPATPDPVHAVVQVWEQFQSAGAIELDATLLLPSDSHGKDWKAFLDELPIHFRNQVAVHIYDPAIEEQRRYLASSAAGERIYLSHYITDADLIVSIGVISFDLLFGVQGTNSAIYPAFSESSVSLNARKDVNLFLTPDDKRPLRELVDEIGWLLGTQFCVQMIPTAKSVDQTVLCGAPDAVMKAGREILDVDLRVAVDEEFDMAIVTLQQQTLDGWKQFGAALASAKRLVGEDGRIAVIAELPDTYGMGLDLLRRGTEAAEVSKILDRNPTEDAIETLQIIDAIVHARVYLLSNLAASVVEDFGMLPLANQSELQRLTDSAESLIVVHDANYVWATVAQNSFG